MLLVIRGPLSLCGLVSTRQTIFQQYSKFDENCSSLKETDPVIAKFCTFKPKQQTMHCMFKIAWWLSGWANIYSIEFNIHSKFRLWYLCHLPRQEPSAHLPSACRSQYKVWQCFCQNHVWTQWLLWYAYYTYCWGNIVLFIFWFLYLNMYIDTVFYIYV